MELFQHVPFFFLLARLQSNIKHPEHPGQRMPIIYLQSTEMNYRKNEHSKKILQSFLQEFLDFHNSYSICFINIDA